MSKIILYHGTIADFSIVDLRHTKANKDFGRGFYLTAEHSQARAWANKMKIRQVQRGYFNATGFIYSFKLDTQSFKSMNIHTFKGANRAWLDYVVANRDRSRNGGIADFDIVIGKVADANTQVLIDEYVSLKDYSENAKDRLIVKLKTENLSDQYCFKTEKAIALLNYGESYREVIH